MGFHPNHLKLTRETFLNSYYMCCWCPVLSELCWLANGNSLKAWIQLLVAKPETWAKLCTEAWVNRRRGQRVALFSLLLLLLTWAQMSLCYIDKGNSKSHSEITGLLSEPFQDRRHPHPPVCRVVWSVLPRWVDTVLSAEPIVSRSFQHRVGAPVAVSFPSLDMFGF